MDWRVPELSQHIMRNHKSLGSGGSMDANLKLKGIDGRAHKEWRLRLNLTQHGETYACKTWVGLTEMRALS